MKQARMDARRQPTQPGDSPRSLVIGTAIAAALGAGATASANISLTVAPLRDERTIVPGEPFTETIAVSNSGDDRIHLRARVLDWTLDRTGVQRFSPVASEDGSAALAPFGSAGRWLLLNPMEFDLEPGHKQIVRYTLTTPADLTPGGYHAAILFEATTRVREARSLAARGAIASTLYFVAGAPRAQVAIRAMECPELIESGRGHVTVTVENAGDLHVRLKGSASVVGEDGVEVISQPLPDAPVLPRSQRQVSIDWDRAVAPGRYTVRATLDMGDSPLLVGETTMIVVSEGRGRTR